MIEVWTNGAISPAEAVRQAARELVDHFFKFSTLSETDAQAGDRPSWAAAIPAVKYNMPVESLNLTARTLNCLKRVSIHKVGEILEQSRADLLRIRNFGEKSLEELDQRLGEIDIRHPDFQPPRLAPAEPEAAAADIEDDSGDVAEAVAVASGLDKKDEEG